MATTKKFQMTALKSDSSSFSTTVPNPKDGITQNEVTNFLNGYAQATDDSLTLKTAKYIETSETYIYPVS